MLKLYIVIVVLLLTMRICKASEQTQCFDQCGNSINWLYVDALDTCLCNAKHLTAEEQQLDALVNSLTVVQQ